MLTANIPESLRASPVTLKRRLWEKLSSQAKRAGQDLVETTLKLYFSARDDSTPAWAKTVIYGALVYFLVPIDAVPDLLPTGYGDDLATLLTALATVSTHIKEEHTSKAKALMEKWFPDRISE